jgi:hypothetical protein
VAVASVLRSFTAELLCCYKFSDRATVPPHPCTQAIYRSQEVNRLPVAEKGCNHHPSQQLLLVADDLAVAGHEHDQQ